MSALATTSSRLAVYKHHAQSIHAANLMVWLLKCVHVVVTSYADLSKRANTSTSLINIKCCSIHSTYVRARTQHTFTYFDRDTVSSHFGARHRRIRDHEYHGYECESGSSVLHVGANGRREQEAPNPQFHQSRVRRCATSTAARKSEKNEFDVFYY